MKSADFQKFLAIRDDGYWELLASAVGSKSSVPKTLAGLEAKALALGVKGPAVTPSLVQQRVEALAVHQPSLLVELSKQWPTPACLSSDNMDEERDFLIAAWASAVRFLVSAKAVTPDDLRSDILAIREEAEVHFGTPQHVPRTWDELVHVLPGRDASYAWLRALDRADLPLPTINGHMIRQLLLDEAGEAPTFGRARVLRGREMRLAPDAIKVLCDAVWFRATSDRSSLGSPGLAIAVEVAVSISPDLRAKLTDVVIEALKSGARPDDLAFLSYVLLGCGWKMP